MQIFNFNGATVRTVTLAGGEPGFVGKDVAERLGYKDTINSIKQHCRGVRILHPIPDALGLTSADFSADLPDSYGRMQPVWYKATATAMIQEIKSA